MGLLKSMHFQQAVFRKVVAESEKVSLQLVVLYLKIHSLSVMEIL